MAARLALPGTYVFRFAGFDRDSNRSRHVAGVGHLVLAETAAGKGTIVSGEQRVTNSPMMGHRPDLMHSAFALSGTYEVIHAGPPIRATATVTFTRGSGSGRERMSDTFALVQSGPDRFWIVSTDPRDESGKTIAELVAGELIRVDPDTW